MFHHEFDTAGHHKGYGDINFCGPVEPGQYAILVADADALQGLVALFLRTAATDDRKEGYLHELEAKAAQLPRPHQVQFAGSRFANVRVSPNGSGPVFSLSDGYAHAHACTYFSRYEGFGNAFVEALAARVPIFVNNYKPVYWPDIGSKGFKTVQIEDNHLSDQAVEEIREILTDADRRAEIAEYNFELGRQHFSYQVLSDLLTPLLP